MRDRPRWLWPILMAFVIGLKAEDNLTIRLGVVDPLQEYVKEAVSVMTDLRFAVNFYNISITAGGAKVYTKIKRVYSQIKSLNLQAIIGPYDNAVALGAEEQGIPYVSTTPVLRDNLNYTVQLMPRLEEISQAVLDYAQFHDWNKISVFYDDDKGVTMLEKLMTNHSMTVRAWRLPNKASGRTVRGALVDMRKVAVERSIVFCGKDLVKTLLSEARNLAMLSTPPYEWVFYDPGDELSDLFVEFNEISVNFTIFSLLPYKTNGSARGHHQLDRALASDAVQLVTSSIEQVKKQGRVDNSTMKTIKFRNETTLAIKNNKEKGMIGSMSFDGRSKRSNFSVNIQAFIGHSNYSRGVWLSEPESMYDSSRNLRLFDDGDKSNRTKRFPLKGRTVKVVMILEKPFTMTKRDAVSRKGNDRYEGFAVELLEEVATRLQFKYEIYIVHDGKFGSRQRDGSWNGIIGELLEGNATMSVAPLSINSQREEAVDFTKPFMTRYISVLMRVPTREVSYFEFLNPLSPIVWICTLCAFVIVSFVLYVLERIGTSKTSSNSSISVRESFWFIFGSLLQGNTDATPATIPGRILTSAWWFFALILISSYTANLAAFLTVKKINTPIKTVTDLTQQTKIKYGTVKDSGVMGFFKNTNIEHFAKMWAQMSEIDPGSLVNSTDDGYEKVKNEDYAFFWDTTVNRYKTITDCEVMEIDPPFDPKGFGIGVPPGATYREELSMAVLKLSDEGRLHELENKWWGSRNCPDLAKPASDETSELQIENVAGVFFILVGGIVFAGMVCGVEYLGRMICKSSKSNKDRREYSFNSKEKASFI